MTPRRAFGEVSNDVLRSGLGKRAATTTTVKREKTTKPIAAPSKTPHLSKNDTLPLVEEVDDDVDIDDDDDVDLGDEFIPFVEPDSPTDERDMKDFVSGFWAMGCEWVYSSDVDQYESPTEEDVNNGLLMADSEVDAILAML